MVGPKESNSKLISKNRLHSQSENSMEVSLQTPCQNLERGKITVSNTSKPIRNGCLPIMSLKSSHKYRGIINKIKEGVKLNMHINYEENDSANQKRANVKQCRNII